MQAIEYVAPASIDEAVGVLQKHGDTARVLAGGSDVIVQAREGRRDVRVMVDVKSIAETMAITMTAEGLKIGAATPCAVIYDNADVAKKYPALVESAALIGGIQIQSRASIGGNLCNSSPAADSIPTLIALGAVCEIAGPTARRMMLVEDFCTAPGRNALKPGELLVSITFPAPGPNSGAAFERFIPRNEMDIAVVNAAANVTLSADGSKFEAARISVGAVAPTPLFVKAAGDALVGHEVSDERIDRAADLVAAAATPITDMRGSAAQRKHLAAVLTRRVLKTAIARAKGA